MNEIIDACKRGDADKFKQLFSQVVDHKQLLGSRDKNGWMLIHSAAEGGSMEIVSIILEKGGIEQVTAESRPDRNTPINISLLSGKLSAPMIASLLLDKLRELEAAPRRNREGNYPIHYACKAGYLELIKSLQDSFPETMYADNAKGKSPLSFAVWEGHREAVSILLDRTSGTPSQFGDFSSLFETANSMQLDPAVDVFILGDNRCGKSSLIKSIQGESRYDRFWGVSYNTPDVPSNEIGLVPTDFTSKKFGRVIFQDLASGANFLNMDLFQTQEDVERALFFIVIDSRPEKKEMESRLEFWLNVIHRQCSKVSQGTTTHPNVIIVSSFYDYIRSFRNANDVRLRQVFRKVASANRKLISGMNIIDYQSLNCRRAQSPAMDSIRHSLKRSCRQLRPDLHPVNSRSYILSNILAEMEQEEDDSTVPMISLGDLSQKIEEKSAVSAMCLHSLVPSDIPQLLQICQALESRKRVLLLRNGPHTFDEDISVVYGQHKIAGLIDEAFRGLKEQQQTPEYEEGRPAIPNVAFVEKQEFQHLLADRLSVSVDVVDKLLEYFKMYNLSDQDEIANHLFDQPHYFFPTFLPKKNPEEEEWVMEDLVSGFAWTFKPASNQHYRYFMPTFMNSLLINLFELCASTSIDFDYRTLWQGGINFRQKDKIEICVSISSRAITLNMRYQASYEISSLHLRNKLLHQIRVQKEKHQRDIETEEFIIPKDGAKFPVGSPSSPKRQILVRELKQSISVSSLSLASSLAFGLQSSTSSLQLTRKSSSVGSLETPALPFFEPCSLLCQLDTTSRQHLIFNDHAEEELSDPFLYELQKCFGPDCYNSIEDYFNLPPLASSVAGFTPHPPSSPPLMGVAPHQRSGSLSLNCNTYGKLVKALDSISIFSTTSFLAELQQAEISRTPTTSTSVSIDNVSRSAGSSTPTPVLSSKRLLPYTTRPISSSSTQSRLSNVDFIDPIQVFTVESDGGVFHSAQNDITIKFPRGAVPDNSPPVTVQFGVALNGPFDVPDGKKPVSPFMWFCTDVPNFVFHRSIEIVMPHYISLSESDYNKLNFMKAQHKDGDNDDFLFKDCTDPMRFKARSNHGVLLTKHSCFLCIAAKISESMVMNANYCLMKVTPKVCDKVFKLYFIATYFLQTCMETVQKQFDENYDVNRNLVHLTMSRASTEPEVSISFLNELPNGWIAVNDGGQLSITASEIDFWHRDIDQLRTLHTYGMYPPRFTIEVSGAEATKNTFMAIQFDGLKRPMTFQVHLHIPQGPPPLPTEVSSTSVGSDNSSLTLTARKPSTATATSTVSLHPLDRIILQLVQYLDVDKIRLRLRQKGILTNEDLQVLLDLSANPRATQALRVERLVQILIRKGEAGMTAFIEALKLTTDGTGHRSILESLLQDTESSTV